MRREKRKKGAIGLIVARDTLRLCVMNSEEIFTQSSQRARSCCSITLSDSLEILDSAGIFRIKDDRSNCGSAIFAPLRDKNFGIVLGGNCVY